MQLHELLDMHDLEHISQKTNIAKHQLQKLFGKEFDTFKRPQLLGFVSIIEREFRVDMSPLKKEAIAFFEEQSSNKKPKHQFKTLHFQKDENKRGIGKYPVALGFIVILVWLLYKSEIAKEIDHTSFLSFGISMKTASIRSQGLA